MKRELQYTDIACYLPFELEMTNASLDRSYKITEVFFDTGCIMLEGWDNEKHIRMFKPILYSMDDIYKKMQHPDINDGAEFMPIMEMVKLLWNKQWFIESNDASEEFANVPYYYHMNCKIYVRYYNGQLVSYDDKGLLAFHGLTINIINFMNKLHLDYNNLIDAGLAIKKQ